MSNNKQYGTVDEMLMDLDPSFAKDVREQVEACKQVTALMVMRTKANLSQVEFALHVMWSRLKVERVENGTDDELTPEIIQTYKRVCNG